MAREQKEARNRKINGYATGWQGLNVEEILANSTEDYRLVEAGGNVITREEMPAYVEKLRVLLGSNMDLRYVVVAPDADIVWCEWQVGDVVGAGRITVTEAGVSEEKLYQDQT